MNYKVIMQVKITSWRRICLEQLNIIQLVEKSSSVKESKDSYHLS
jgi:hypothetical protein